MPGPFHGIDLAGRALRSFQRALDVTGHNIANVNTKGYSRQTVDFVASDPIAFYENGRQILGTGVDVASINRIRDMFLEARMQGGQSEMQRFSTLAGNLKQIEGVYNEPSDNAIGAALDKFFDGWSALASNPNDAAARIELRASAQTLTSRIQSGFKSFQAYGGQLDAEVKETIVRINQISGSIATLNSQIRADVAAGGTPSDLQDQRDTLLEEMGGLVNIHTEHFRDGTVSVYASQFTLVDGGGARTYPSTYDPVTQTLTDGTNTYSVRSGKLAGLFGSIVANTAQQTDLDTLANNLRAQINPIHRTGINQNATTGLNFFNDVAVGNPPSGAIDFDLDPVIKADIKNISSSTTGLPGDGGLALSLSNLRNQSIAALGNKTLGDYYRDIVTQIGQDANYFAGQQSTQEAIIQQIDAQRQSVSGVSIDDEMSNMLRFQRSYQAAAKVLTVFDQVTDDLLGMLKR